MEEEHAAAEARNEARKATQGQPFRFFLKPGETREIVIVDDKPDFFRAEHQLQNRRTGRWDIFTPCIDNEANCPICAIAERGSSYVMMLTIIDLSPYVNKDGEEVEFSKKLLVVKQQQQKKLVRMMDKQGRGSLRGMVLQMTRDGEKDALIGNDIEFVEIMDEDALLSYETEYVDKEGKAHPVLCHEPYDYPTIFPDMTETQLRAIAGGKSPDSGSREGARRALNDDQWDDNPAPRRAASRRPAADEADEAADDAAPAPRRTARRAEPEAEADETPAPRRAARTTRPATIDPDDSPDAGAEADDPPFEADNAPAPRRTARVARTAPEPEAEADDPPQRAAAAPRAAVSARRASLRR